MKKVNIFFIKGKLNIQSCIKKTNFGFRKIRNYDSHIKSQKEKYDGFPELFLMEIPVFQLILTFWETIEVKLANDLIVYIVF